MTASGTGLGYGEGDESYGYDSCGYLKAQSAGGHRISEETDQYAGGHRLKQAGNTQYDYDAAGRMVSRTRHRDGYRPETERFRWDSRDQLTGYCSAQGEQWEYRHDASGRRTEKRCDRKKIRFTYLWDGDSIAEIREYRDDELYSVRHLVFNGFELISQQCSRVRQPHPSVAPQWVTRTNHAVNDLTGRPLMLFNSEGKTVWRPGQTSLWGLALSLPADTDYPDPRGERDAEADPGLLYAGQWQGLLSVLRLFWGNLINFMANWRALKQVLQHGDPRRVAWDKTTHDFPSVTGDTRSLRPLGQILLENQVITEEQLDTALRNRVEGLRLGGSMLMQGLISAEQLAQALAEQNGVAWESIDAWQIPSSLIAEMPASVALHYAVLPLRLENDELIVGSEDGIDPVSLAALTRKVGRKVRYVIVLRGQIVTGLRHWYARRRGHDPRAMLYNAVQHQWLTEQQAGEIWRQYVPHQFLFAEILTTLGHINRSAINVLLLRHERSSLPLGKFLVTEGVISQETLDRVLTIQRELQVSMQSLLLKAGLNTEQVAQLESENEGE
nr:phage adsorption protein NrfB [Escherichia coli]